MWTLTNLRPSPRSNWNLEVLVFVEEGKPEKPEKNHRSKARTNNKHNPQEKTSTGIELGSQRWEASAYLLRHPCSPNVTPNKSLDIRISWPRVHELHQVLSKCTIKPCTSLYIQSCHRNTDTLGLWWEGTVNGRTNIQRLLLHPYWLCCVWLWIDELHLASSNSCKFIRLLTKLQRSVGNLSQEIRQNLFESIELVPKPFKSGLGIKKLLSFPKVLLISTLSRNDCCGWPYFYCYSLINQLPPVQSVQHRMLVSGLLTL